MKKPERLIGFVEYKGTNYPFEFDEDTFSLRLFPPTEEIWNQDSTISNIFSGLNTDLRKHEWIGTQRLQGVTSERNNIIFEVLEHKGNQNGFYTFSVNWYFYYSAKLDPNRIDGFKIAGEEVNYFFPPQKALEPEIEFNEDKQTLRKMSVTAKDQITESCGKYRVAKNTDANMTVESYAAMHFFTHINPIDATSIFVTTFSKSVNLNSLITAYRNLLLFFMYISYRTNMAIRSADVFSLNDQQERDYQGLLVFKPRSEVETHKSAPDKIIKFSLLKSKTGALITSMKNGEIGFQHLCDSIEDAHHYPTSRIIMILGEFEREFRNIYGKDCDRSADYILVKNDILALIENYRNSTSGKRRKYAGQLWKYVDNRDSSFETNLKKALKDCEEILKPFTKKRYAGEYEEIISNLSSRMGEVRNGIAHSRLDLHFDAVHLCDIKIVEELLYAMRLKKLRLKTPEIQKAINNLFIEHISL
ncbi:hypothetical protein [Agathobaculum sp. Marseille-P7918]|uniref:hypothetical protein n=1 Tax=Agathobaculum sp. Marseille-P7918 TaxID=2479843 RepID=UPI000F642E22|nr:hypothetical protein [Agathobaculum sp. Marseille-P7918]